MGNASCRTHRSSTIPLIAIRSLGMRVALIGPLPPPIHGLSTVHQRMFNEIARCNACVKVFDVAPRSWFNVPYEVLRFLFWTIKTYQPDVGTSLYLSLSGGPRQLIDIIFLLIGKIFRFRLFVHHHSFAYLDKPVWYSKLLFRITKCALHITLCKRMSEKLISQYSIPLLNCFTLTNAAFNSPNAHQDIDDLRKAKAPNIGFISNITREKGIFVFLETAAILRRHGLIDKIYVAGPVEKSIESSFFNELESNPDIIYLGPVYGETKSKFFRDIDILLFPTLYKNEAEPLTLLEASSYGVLSIALSRGCINDMLPRVSCKVVFDPTQFSDYCITVFHQLSFIQSWPSREYRDNVRNGFLAVQSSSTEQLHRLINNILNRNN